MQKNKVLFYLNKLLDGLPSDWLNLTTHRLDIYNEPLAKTQFLEQFDLLFKTNNATSSTLQDLPTAYDYIRLGHPLSCILEWTIAKLNGNHPEQVISFSSQTMPILAVLRSNLLIRKKTRILFSGTTPKGFNPETIKHVYGYDFDLIQIEDINLISEFEGSTILVVDENQTDELIKNNNIDFTIYLYDKLGSVIVVDGDKNTDYISKIQHVRRRESIAMTPANCVTALQAIASQSNLNCKDYNLVDTKGQVLNTINAINNINSKVLVGSSGLSIQYAIMMGLVDHALEKHNGKPIKFIVPTNCYGGTNDQARRLAAALNSVEVVDLQVDGDNDMVTSLDVVLSTIATEDAIPYIIAEIPTNPRVEVPDMEALKTVLTKRRSSSHGNVAVAPVFILDQTFCPNLQFLSDDSLLASIQTIAYVSGSKFPSGGKCTAGYCLTNNVAKHLISKIETHLTLCDNEATDLQYQILANQIPSMLQRISNAYQNTRDFVNFIEETLPDAKINFVSKHLAQQGFTPSVFSLDLPTKGNTPEEKERYKRDLNHKLINLMITKIPDESKYCVSYGQLKGCYWTIPATSTQGTTKEGDKDYIARVAVSPNLDLNKHKAVFQDFVDNI
ncbi:MAG: cystathionine beta-synthase [Winogradskyella sp.]|uniref:cystathionine beta-synthase n=1 Tax=Winogradskyella sp. TaxID=1883156 RepID=UPI0025EBCD85|nr:cystathionine beta-synthase [Winogradskyella sp.]NRB83339.1 cystathionine beta-synthase [Winogradskyella sp.]